MECTVEEENKGHDETAIDRILPLSFTANRHTDVIQGIDFSGLPWRLKERMKTVSVALVLCLNVGVDPPDIVKTQPCARLECWIDPLTMSPPKALEAIAASLQKQYERWQPRARYKQALDPTTEDVKKLCTSLRRNAKDERVLFHYNGHGVPKPTTNGEIWVFNRTYTQYIPLSIYDLQAWMGSPSIYVYDCSNAGLIIDSFNAFAKQHEQEFDAAVQQGRIPATQEPPAYGKCIHLAACSAAQVLPMNPDLPADLFTSCLTTPIKVAVRWFITRHSSKLVPEVTLELIEKIPGQLADRKTMLGELNWILTAITDTIAWNILPRELFQKLFRQDLLVASLFRNFLLAERILRSYGCTPVSSPAMPHTHQHPMWNAWDYALDLSLMQLPEIINHSKAYRQLTFFEDQLTAFQMWLRLGSSERDPPVQLPIVLQVLLSQVHRLRALELLAKFLDLGSWAVNLGLSVGIFPYVLKLLQSSAAELRPLLVFIWAKILSVDNTCQNDLVREKAHTYFIAILKDPTIPVEYRTQAAFVLSCIVNGCPEGQDLAKKDSLVSNCLLLLNDPNPQLKKWVIICLGRLWDRHEDTRMVGGRDNAHGKLESVLTDPCPEVRAATLYACGTYINAVTGRYEHINTIDHSLAQKLYNTLGDDMNYMVRLELVAALQWVVFPFELSFINAANQENNPNSEGSATPTFKRTGSRQFMSPNISCGEAGDSADRIKRVASSSSISALSQTSLVHHGSLGTLSSGGQGKSWYTKIWVGLCKLEKDPHPEVAQAASKITTYIRNKLKDSLTVSKEQIDRMSSSMSLPPSPNRSSNYLSGDSPPTLMLNSDLQRLATKTSLANRNRRLYQQSDEKNYVPRDPLVTTQFVSWSCKYFAEPLMKCEAVDFESTGYYEREWRFERNAMVRRDANEELKRSSNSKLDAQIFCTRASAPPRLLKFHPNDQQIAVANNDNFGIWDWGRGAKICHRNIKSAKYPGNTHISSFEWINSHDVALLMTGSDDGSVHLWNPNKCTNREPALISAWQAYNDMVPIKMTNLSGLLLNWEQQTHTVITAGDAKYIRFWDVEHEQFTFEILTEIQSPVTCLDSTFLNYSSEGFEDSVHMTIDCEPAYLNRQKEGLVAAGFKNGQVKLFDRRCSVNEAVVRSWIEQKSWILNMKLRDNNIITGCIDGEVRIYDIRKNDPITITKVAQPNEMCAFAIHPTAELYACGLVSHCVSVHNFSGRNLNVIRYYEGFMSHKIGPVSCLAFHPRKIALAAGNIDCSITLYALDSRGNR